MKKTIRDIDWAGKRALVRCDFNVPLDKELNITDETRIKAALPTLKYLIESGARTIIMSHLGRPKGEANPEFSLLPVAKRLGELLDRKVAFVSSPTVVDHEVREQAEALGEGEVLLLENTRFRKEEEKNDPEFSKELASLGDVFVQEAFGTAHRAHASTAGVADYLPCVSGFLIEKEVEFLDQAINNPERPFVAIMGGSKVSDKILVIENLLTKVDTLIIGGGMMFTFYKAMGWEIGKSILDEDHIEVAASIMKQAEEKGVKLLLPVDVMCAEEFNNDAARAVYAAEEIPETMMGLDIGPKSIEIFVDEIKKAKEVIWNGPMGVFEMSNFAEGTKGICQGLASSDCISIIGGGDSAAAVEQFGYGDKMNHISTGGGASLEYLEGKVLPGIAIIEDK